MFYSDYDNYMQDFYYYNQLPNRPYNMNNSYNNNDMLRQNNYPNGYFPYGNNNNMNNFDLTKYYPSIYRIINPVVCKIIQNSNYQFLNEDTLNNMVETVYNIVEGQIEYSDEPIKRDAQNNINAGMQMNSNSTAKQMSPNNLTNNNEKDKGDDNFYNTKVNLRSDNLIKDLIKILLIKELLSRKNYLNMQMNQNTYYSRNSTS